MLMHVTNAITTAERRMNFPFYYIIFQLSGSTRETNKTATRMKKLSLCSRQRAHNVQYEVDFFPLARADEFDGYWLSDSAAGTIKH